MGYTFDPLLFSGLVPTTPPSSVPTVPTVGSLPATAANGSLYITLDTGDVYEYRSSIPGFVIVAGPGVMLSIGPIDSQTASANGAVDANNSLVLQSASATVPGLVNNTSQTFSGAKTLTSPLSLNSNQINNVANPSLPQDAMTLAYADANYINLDQEGVANGVATLDGGGHIPLSQLPSSLVEYKGTWDASTNTPTLADGTGVAGWFYIVSAPGTVDFGSGPITFEAGDWVLYNGTIWERADNFTGYANSTLSNLESPVAVNQNLTPQSSSLNIGGPSGFSWQHLYVGTLNDDSDNTSVDVQSRFLDDSTGGGSVAWNSRILLDSPGQTSVDWGNRTLIDSAGNNQLNWSTSGIQIPNDPLDMATHQIHNVVDPTAPQDAATKNYVDTTIPLAAFANQTLSNLTSPTAINQDLIPADTTVSIFNTGIGAPGSPVVSLNGTSITKFGQPFTTSINQTVDQAQIAVNETGTPLIGNIQAHVYSDSAGTPGSVLSSSNFVAASTITSPGQIVTFSFPSPFLTTATTPYWIVIDADSTYFTGSNFIQGLQGTSGTQGNYLFFGSWIGSSAPFAVAANSIQKLNLGTSGASWGVEYVDQINIGSGGIDLNSHNITSVLDPVNPQDAATKAYVDSVVVSGANTTLSNLTTPVAVNQNLTPQSSSLNIGGPSGFSWQHIYVGTINDDADNTSIDPQARNLDDSTASTSINWDSRLLLDAPGQTSVDWANRTLIDSAGNNQLNWSTAGIQLPNNALDMATHQINNVVDPSSAQDAATKNYVDTAGFFKADGSVVATGNFDMAGNRINNVSDPSSAGDVATKNYVDTTSIPLTAEGAINGVATLDGAGHIPLSQLPASLVEYKGTWDASTNTPTLVNGTGTSGWFYIVSTGGTVNFGAGPITFNAGDWVLYNGTIWEQAVQSNIVQSVNSQTGIVTVNAINQLTGDVTAGPATGSQSVAATIGANKVTNSQLAQAPTLTLKGNNTGSTANVSDLTVSQVNTMLGTLTNPMTTGGDIIVGGSSGTPNRLANGNTGQVLQSAGGTSAPAWVSSIGPSSGLSIVGTNTNNNASSGIVGEIIVSNPVSPVALAATTVFTNITSIILTPGDWDVDGSINLTWSATATGFTFFTGAISTISATVDAANIGGFVQNGLNPSIVTTFDYVVPTGTRRVAIPSTTIIYLIGRGGYTSNGGSTWGVDSFIRARRVR